MKYSIVAAANLLAGFTSARHCQNLTIPVHVAARNGVFSLSAPITNIDVTDFILDLTQQGVNYTQEVLQGYTTVSGTYKIAATYCQPDTGPAKTLQILTAGIGFGRSYWDIAFNNYNYSYVNEVVDHYGYSTFTWDRLGTGESQHGNPVSEIQSLLEVDALRALTMMLHNGQIKGIPNAFKKVVHVGFSYGSLLTYALTAMHPNISDGLALTGFSQNGSFVPYFELGSNFIQANKVAAFSEYPDGYFVAESPTGLQIVFLAPGQFDPAILTYSFKARQPTTVGELLTIGGVAGSKNAFAGPVLIVTGERDVPFCGGNCLAAPTGYPNIPSTSKTMLPYAKDFLVTIVPNAGHGLNLDYSHPFTYRTVQEYFIGNGLGPNGG